NTSCGQRHPFGGSVARFGRLRGQTARWLPCPAGRRANSLRFATLRQCPPTAPTSRRQPRRGSDEPPKGRRCPHDCGVLVREVWGGGIAVGACSVAAAWVASLCRCVVVS